MVAMGSLRQVLTNTITWLCLLHSVRCQVLQYPPSFISTGPYVIEANDQLGSVLTLPCVAIGQPQPTYSWTMNGLPFTKQPVSDGTLVFNPVDQTLNGYYQCSASNSVGKALSNSTRVIVARQAAFQDIPSIQRQYAVGSPYILQCNVYQQAIPTPRVSVVQMGVFWQYQSASQPLLLSTRIQEDSTGALYNAYAQTSDSSVDPICCHVKNRINGVEVQGSCYTVTITGQPAQPPQPSVMFYPNMTNNPGGTTTTVMALEGGNATLRCFFGGSNQISYGWSRLDAPLPTDGRVQQLGNFVELTIFKVQMSDQGQYECQGTFPATGQVLTVKINLFVNAAPRFFDINSQPHDTNATVGSDVYVQCNPYAVPDATIQWLKNGNPFNPSATPGFSLSNNGRTLTINSVCKDKCPSNGNGPMVIQCNASNPYGYAFSNGYINVFIKTLIPVAPVSLVATPDGKAKNFSVVATSDPNTPITYTWYFRPFSSDPNNPNPETILASSDKYSITSNNGSVLIISSYSDSDIGDYRVVAANGVDQAEARFQLGSPKPLFGANVWPYWWIPLIIILFFVILICVICIVCYCMRVNRGDEYPVDQKEREADRDPVKELSDTGFQDYVRQSKDIERQPLTLTLTKQ